MSVFSKSHKAEGLFALDSLNGNCWSTAVAYGILHQPSYEAVVTPVEPRAYIGKDPRDSGRHVLPRESEREVHIVGDRLGRTWVCPIPLVASNFQLGPPVYTP